MGAPLQLSWREVEAMIADRRAGMTYEAIGRKHGIGKSKAWQLTHHASPPDARFRWTEATSALARELHEARTPHKEIAKRLQVDVGTVRGLLGPSNFTLRVPTEDILEMVRLRVELKMTYRAIGKRVGRNRESVRSLLKPYVPEARRRFKKITPAVRAAMRTMRAEKRYSYECIGAHFGYAADTVFRHCRDLNIPSNRMLNQQAVLAAVQACGGKQSKAARRHGWNRHSVHKICRREELRRESQQIA